VTQKSLSYENANYSLLKKDHFLDADGSLTIELKLSIYLHVHLETVVGGGPNALTALKEFGGEKRLLEIVASLLGDSQTSDMTVSVVDDMKTKSRRSSIVILQFSAVRIPITITHY